MMNLFRTALACIALLGPGLARAEPLLAEALSTVMREAATLDVVQDDAGGGVVGFMTNALLEFDMAGETTDEIGLGLDCKAIETGWECYLFLGIDWGEGESAYVMKVLLSQSGAPCEVRASTGEIYDACGWTVTDGRVEIFLLG